MVSNVEYLASKIERYSEKVDIIKGNQRNRLPSVSRLYCKQTKAGDSINLVKFAYNEISVNILRQNGR